MAEKGDQGRGGAGLQGRAAPWFHVGSGWRDVLAAAQGRGFPSEEKVGEEDCLPVSKGESCLFRNSFIKGCPDSSVGEEFTCNAGDPGLIPGSGRAPGEGIGYPLQYSWASLVAQLVKNLPAMWETWFDPDEIKVKNWPAMWETWVQSLGWEDCLEKGKATHSSILDSRIPWTV